MVAHHLSVSVCIWCEYSVYDTSRLDWSSNHPLSGGRKDITIVGLGRFITVLFVKNLVLISPAKAQPAN